MATAATEYEDRDVSIGRVLERAFATIAHNPLVALSVAVLLGAVPSVIVNYLSHSLRGNTVGSAQNTSTMWGVMAFSWLLMMVIGAVVQGAMTRATVAEGEGQRASLGECLAAGARVLLPLIAVALLFGLAMMVGFLLLVVPGIIVMVMWSVAAPAVVVERDGVFASLSRSQELTKGHRWKILGLFLVLLVIYIIVFVVLGFIGLSTIRSPSESFTVVNLVGSLITSAVVNLLWGTIQPSLYVELRQARNGGTLSSLEQIFA